MHKILSFESIKKASFFIFSCFLLSICSNAHANKRSAEDALPDPLYKDVNPNVVTANSKIKFVPSVLDKPSMTGMTTFVEAPENVLRSPFAPYYPICVFKMEGRNQNIFGFVNNGKCNASYARAQRKRNFFYVTDVEGEWLTDEEARPLHMNKDRTPRIFSLRGIDMGICALVNLVGKSVPNVDQDRYQRCWHTDINEGSNREHGSKNGYRKFFAPFDPAKPPAIKPISSVKGIETNPYFTFVDSKVLKKPGEYKGKALTDEKGNKLCFFVTHRNDQFISGYVEEKAGNICRGAYGAGPVRVPGTYYIAEKKDDDAAPQWLPYAEAHKFIINARDKEKDPFIGAKYAKRPGLNFVLCSIDGVAGKAHGAGHKDHCWIQKGNGYLHATRVGQSNTKVLVFPKSVKALHKDVDGAITSRSMFKFIPSSKPMPADVLKSPATPFYPVCTMGIDQGQNVFGFVKDGKCHGSWKNAIREKGFYYVAGAKGTWMLPKDAKQYYDKKDRTPRVFKPNAPGQIDMGICAYGDVVGKVFVDATRAPVAQCFAASEDVKITPEQTHKTNFSIFVPMNEAAAKLEANKGASLEKLAADQAALAKDQKALEAQKLAAEEMKKKATEQKAAADAAAAKLASEKLVLEMAAKKAADEKAASEKAEAEAEAAKKTADEALKQAQLEQALAKTAAQKIAADKAKAQAVIDKAAADQAAAKAALEKAEAEKSLAKAASEKAQLDKIAAQEAEKKKAEAELAASKASRQKQEAENAAKKAAEEKIASQKASEKAKADQLAAEEATKKAQAALAAAQSEAEKKLAEIAAMRAKADAEIAQQMASLAEQKKAAADAAVSKAEAEKLEAARVEAQAKATTDTAKAEADAAKKALAKTEAENEILLDVSLKYEWHTIEEAQRKQDNVEGIIVRLGREGSYKAVCRAKPSNAPAVTVPYAGILSRNSGKCGLPSALGVPTAIDEDGEPEGGFDEAEGIEILVAIGDIPLWQNGVNLPVEQWATGSASVVNDTLINPTFGICRIQKIKTKVINGVEMTYPKHYMGMAINRNGGECYLRGDPEGKPTPFSGGNVEVLVQPKSPNNS